MFIKSLIVLLGLWLLFQVWRLLSGPRSSKQPEVRSNAPSSEKSPFQDPSIKDADFEEVNEGGEKRGGE